MRADGALREPAVLRNGVHAHAPVSREVVGSQLKSLFAELTSGPMPDRLLALVDQLENAYARGELGKEEEEH